MPKPTKGISGQGGRKKSLTGQISGAREASKRMVDNDLRHNAYISASRSAAEAEMRTNRARDYARADNIKGIEDDDRPRRTRSVAKTTTSDRRIKRKRKA